MDVEYNSNNSNGYWWLKDEDWKKLEENGWEVLWKKDGRWLGALATSAVRKNIRSVKCAIAEWEDITGQDASDEGCHCCGQPHYFSEV